MPPQALAAVATLLSFAPQGNRIEFHLDRGSAEMVWLTPSSFRFRRALEGRLEGIRVPEPEPVTLAIDDAPGRVAVRSRFLEVSIQKSGLLVRVRRLDGTPLMTDLTEPRAAERGVVWERQSPPGAQFYGLGPRTAEDFDVRGSAVDTEVPFLVCTAGYGEYHAAGGGYRFDFTARDRYRVEAPAVDYLFYYGPAVKQIFEEHRPISTAAPGRPVSQERAGAWEGLQATLLRLVHGAMSGMLKPSLSLRPYYDAKPELKLRAQQLGSLVDDVSPGPMGVSDLRKQLETFFATYNQEMQDRGFPIWHPLPFQFPDDPECARHADEFMLGDEMLVAPVYQANGRRSVYLPQGNWTNLETNARLPGRRTIGVETRSLPVFARNGTIVPLDSPGGMGLHYFPALAAEFFLLETDPPGWSQVHAAPAGDLIRLEIESRKTRDYEWVVHHIDRPAAVGFEEKKYREAGSRPEMANGTWYYDAPQRNLHVRVHAAGGEDCILNVMFP
jgi:hypothetical protein